MKLSFIPGDLHLSDSPTGYVLTIGKNEVFRTQSERSAVSRFNRLRTEMEKNGVTATLVSAPARKPPEVAPGNPPQKMISRAEPPRRVRKTETPARKARPTAGNSAAQSTTKSIPNSKSAGIGRRKVLSELRQRRERVERAMTTKESLESTSRPTARRKRK